MCTWTAAHLAAVEAAADRGLPIFCEKPLAPDLAAATAGRGGARTGPASGRARACAGRRCSGTSRDAVASGEHGRVLAAVMRDDQYFPVQGLYGSTWRGDVEHAGGGTVIEHSIHDIDVLRWMLGDPVEVSAAHRVRASDIPGIEDTAAATFSYADGSVAQLTSVWHQVLTRESSRRLEVFCEKALLWTDDDYLGPLHVQTDDGEHVVEARTADAGAAGSRCPRSTRKRWPSTPNRRRRFSTRWRDVGAPRAEPVSRRPWVIPAPPTRSPRIAWSTCVYRSAADGGMPKSVS